MRRPAPSLAALLPLKVTGGHYGDNLARLDLLLSSLLARGDADLVDDFVVVTPHDEVPVVEAFAAGWPELGLRVVDEEGPFEAFGRYRRPWQVRPWQRQQVIKLNAPALTAADYVLTLDPDVLAVGPVSRPSLFPDGRALLQSEPRDVHPRWWRDSAGLLGVRPDLTRRGMGVTPAVLSREVLLAAQERLAARHRRPWMDVLLTSYCDWTEYTLYLLAAEQADLLEWHHRWCGDADDTVTPLQVSSGTSIWDRAAATPENVERLLSGHDPGLFAVVQSNTGLAAEQVAAVVARHHPVRRTSTLPLSPPPGPSAVRARGRTAARIAATGWYRGRHLLDARR